MNNVYRLPHRPVAIKPNLYDSIEEQLRIERAIAEAERDSRAVWRQSVVIAAEFIVMAVCCLYAIYVTVAS